MPTSNATPSGVVFPFPPPSPPRGAGVGRAVGSQPDSSGDVVQRADVSAAMQRLSGRDQEVLELHLWEGLEPREIAEVLGLSTVVVRPRLSRARARLRDLLGNEPPSSGHDSSRPTQLIREDRP